MRFVERFVADAELPALFRRADLVVLPYREIDQSGVLFTALAFGRPLLLSAVGGFPEVAAAGAAELVPPGDPGALHDALRALLADPAARERLAAGRARGGAPSASAGTRSPAGISSSTARWPRRRHEAGRARPCGARSRCSPTRRPATRCCSPRSPACASRPTRGARSRRRRPPPSRACR